MQKLYAFSLIFLLAIKAPAQTAVSSFANPSGNYSTSTSGLCIGCSISNPSLVADATLTNYATIFMVAGVSATYGIRAKLNANVPGGTFAGFYLNVGVGVSALPSVTVRTYKAGAFRETIINDGDLLTLLSLNGGYLCGLTNTSLDYDEVGISFKSGLATALLNADIYFAFGGYSSCPTSVLPIKLHDLKYVSIEAGTKLQWEAEDEGYTKYIVERSFDGKNFDSIGIVQSETLAGKKTLDYIDDHTYATSVYYRLLVVPDNMLTNYFSRTIWVVAKAMRGTDSFVVYPNPVTGNKFWIELLSGAGAGWDFQIVSSGGSVVSKGKLMPGNYNSFEIRLKKELNPGIYFLRLIKWEETEVRTSKILVKL